MNTLLKVLVLLSIFAFTDVFAQLKAEDTQRAGSGGSAGTTQQGPVYDGGVLGPNAAMGAPDVTAVDKAGEVRKPSKKPLGTIRFEAQPNLEAFPPPR